MYPITKATENLRRAFEIATQAAGKVVETNFVGSEHLLYAFFNLPECEAYAILTSSGLDGDEYERSFRMNTKGTIAKTGLTDATQAIYDRAVEQAQRQGLQASTAHFLYQLLGVNCQAMKYIGRMAGESLSARKELMETLEERTARAIEILAEKQRAGENTLDGTSALSEPSIAQRFEKLRQAEKMQARTEVSLADTEREKKSKAAQRIAKLPDCGIDMTERARRGKLDPVIGRKKEIEKVVQVLARRMKNNPVLIGEPGVGKSAIVEGLSQLIVSGQVPEQLLNKTVFSVDLPGMLAGTRYRGDFEEKLKNLVDTVMKDGDVILFIDEIHTMVGAGGSSESNMDAGNILKPLLSRGDLQVVGATTVEEYRKYIEKDSALERRFTPVYVDEPSEKDAIEILKGLRSKYERHHGVAITDEAIEGAVKLSTRYITDRYLPDKAIDLIDEAAARVRISEEGGSAELQEVNREIALLEQERREYESRREYALASQAFNAEQRAFDRKKALEQAEAPLQLADGRVGIGREHIAGIVSARMKIPLLKISQAEGEKLMRLEEDLHGRIIGQKEGVAAVAKAIRRARAGLKDPNRPIGSFIFVGPTGVGKTDLCKALAEALFGSEEQMIRLDMSEYMEKQSISKLIGAPPGYVGYEEGQTGQLTDKIRTKPYSVVLFDEIEKAHPDVFNLLLQILDDGRLTDNKGRTVSFKNAVIILTSNIGASLSGLGALSATPRAEENYEEMKARITSALQVHFRPEFLNRMDDIIVFHKLSESDCVQIARKLVVGLCKRLVEQRGITLSVTERALVALVKEGYDPDYGARPLKRVLQRRIEDRLSEEILLGRVQNGQSVTVDYQNEYLFSAR